MKYAFNEFTLIDEQPVYVQGTNNFYTYQNTGQLSATVYGSNDGSTWNTILTIASQAVANSQHHYKYLKASSNAQLYVTRSQSNNSSNGNNPSLSSRYGGFWDLSLTINSVVDAVPDPTKSTGFIELSNTNYQYIGDNTPLALSGQSADIVIANSVTNIGSGIRWMRVSVPEYDLQNTNTDIVFGVQNNQSNPLSFFQILSGSTLSNQYTGIVFILQVSDVTNNIYSLSGYLLSNAFSFTNASQILPIVNPLGANLTLLPNSSIYLGVDTDTGTIYLETEGNTPVALNSSLNLLGFVDDTFAPLYGVIWQGSSQFSTAFPESFNFDLGTTVNNKLPFSSSVSSGLLLPLGASDGKVYEAVNGSGTLFGQYIQTGDFVEFYDNLQKVFVTKKPQTQVQLQDFINTITTANLQTNGIIKDAIIEEIQNNKQQSNQTQLILLEDNTSYSINTASNVVSVSSATTTTDALIELPSLVTNIPNGHKLTILFDTNATNLSIVTSPSISISGLGYYFGNPVAGDFFEFILIKSTINTSTYWVRTK